MAKRTDAERRREALVVGGWTESSGDRPFGSLLLGYHDAEGGLVYAGRAGAGLGGDEAEELARRLKRRERKTPPFGTEPDGGRNVRWATPRVVVEVEFDGWTEEGRLREPRLVGVGDELDASDRIRPKSLGDAGPPRTGASPARSSGASSSRSTEARKRGSSSADSTGFPEVVERIAALEEGPGEGVLELPGGASLRVTSLDKVFFPRERLTKGDLLRYYAGMARLVLPWTEDRPLVMRRYPDGILGSSFYQHAPDPDQVPDGVRVETVSHDGDEYPRLVGGDLATLLYTVQLGAVSYDPWPSRVGRPGTADYAVLDLDPGPGASFRRVVEVARALREQLDGLGLHGAPKTSGATGLHVYLPLPEGTPLDAARRLAEVVAARTAEANPRIATVERMTKERPRGTVYVDYLQNLPTKTVAGVYAVRARPGATVSTPLAWDEVEPGLDPRDFTLETVPERVARVGDLWAPAMRRPVPVERVEELTEGME